VQEQESAMVSALLKIKDCSESCEQAAIHGSLGSNCTVSVCTGIEVAPNLLCRTYEQHKNRVRSTTP
jgi:hypothetical protein